MTLTPRTGSIPAVVGTLFALGISGAAVALRWSLTPWLDGQLPLVTLFGAVALTVWLTGYRPAIVAAALGYVACHVLFIQPDLGPAGLRLADLVGLLAYLVSCTIIIGFGETMRRSRAAAREQRELLRITLASIGDAVITTDPVGRVTSLNAVAEALCGWTRAEAEGRPLESVFRIVNEETREPVENPALRALRDGSIVGLANHTLLITRDGSEHPIDDSAAPIRDAEGAIAGCVLVFRDVAERRAAERERARLAAIVTASHDAIVSKTLEGVIQSWNEAAERLFGYSAAEAIGRSITLIVPPELMEEERSILERLRRGERIQHFETVRVTKDGRRLDVSLSVSPVRDAAGRVIGASKVARDISEQKRSERDLARLANELRLVTDAVPALISYVDSTGCYRFNNKAYETWFGHEREKLRGLHLREALGAETYEHIRPYVETALAGRRVLYEDEVPYQDGGARFVSAEYVPDLRADGTVAGFFAFVTDVTERRRAESSRRQFFALAESSGEFIAMCDLELRPSYVNAAGLRMLGLESLEEARRTPVLDFVHPEDRAFVRDEFLPRVSREDRGELEVRFRHLRTGETLWVICSLVLLSDDRGQPTGFGTVTRDITGRKRNEQALREADRRKDEFLATLAHELRNPLAPLRNMLEVLKRSDDDVEVRQQARATMERQLAQLTHLVDDLLDLSRITRGRLELRRESVDLAEIVQQAVETNQPLVEAGRHELSVRLPSEPIFLDGDRVRLAQVLGNLLNNACKYTPPGGRIELAAERRDGEALVTVADSGLGIAADVLPRVFDMFTQEVDSLGRSQGGLGIGLTLARQIVERHGGLVNAASEGPGKGSVFTVRLPALPAGTVLRPAAPRAQPLVTPRRILVVDDNRDSAESLSRLLALNGHETRVAHDGLAALETAEAYRPEVVLLDIGLPGLNGLEVCKQLRERPWGKRVMVIALTGWGQEADRLRSKEAGADAHAVKPVDFDVLTALLASPIHEAGA